MKYTKIILNKKTEKKATKAKRVKGIVKKECGDWKKKWIKIATGFTCRAKAPKNSTQKTN